MLKRLVGLVAAMLVLLPAAGARADVEPNDSAAQAELIPRAPFSLAGTLATDDDADVYAVYLGTAATQLRFEVIQAVTVACPDAAGCSVSGELFQDTVTGPSPVAFTQDAGQVGTDDTVILFDLDYVAPAAGTYFFRVTSSAGRRPAGSYSLAIDADQPLLSY